MNNLVYSASIMGIDAQLISIEVSSMPGPRKLTFIGLDYGDNKNIRTIILSNLNRLKIELDQQHYIVNISPTHIKKDGAMITLAIFLALLNYLEKLPVELHPYLNNTIFIGNLSLHGDIRNVAGAISIALALKSFKKKNLFIPSENISECSLLNGLSIYGVTHLDNLLVGDIKTPQISSYQSSSSENHSGLDINQVYGQEFAKRALQIAAAGRHHLLMYGSPGSGKSMLAKRMVSLLPALTLDQQIEVTNIYSIAQMLKGKSVITQAPFRSPHNSISNAGLLGGGKSPSPGEITLAHNGVLFLDELLEFKGPMLETLRQVLEDKEIHIKRVDYSIKYPAQFILIGAFNPCPCGYYTSTAKNCTCTFVQIKNYLQKISGPFIDRIDMQIPMHEIEFQKIEETQSSSSKDIAQRVQECRKIQHERNPHQQLNGLLEGYEIDTTSTLSRESKEFLEFIFKKMNISMRSYHKIKKLSQTISDFEGSPTVEIHHIKEACMYRSFDKLMEKFNG